jgi:hypothetical protein
MFLAGAQRFHNKSQKIFAQFTLRLRSLEVTPCTVHATTVCTRYYIESGAFLKIKNNSHFSD